jgi:hypothetical protein
MAQFGEVPSVLGQVVRQPLVFLGALQPHLDVRAVTFTRAILFLQLVIGHSVSRLQAKVLDQDVEYPLGDLLLRHPDGH